MKIIADSGSTKTVWRVLETGETQNEFVGSGINPFYQSTDEIVECLTKEWEKSKLKSPESIYFYGAGCANEEKNNIVAEALKRVFDPVSVFIGSDLLGAARSLCQHQEGIACILGTGSNSCFYDGVKIVSNISPLGFILGDEGSGAVMGKKLVADVLKNQFPKNIIELFFHHYSFTSAEIVNAVYRKPFPNRFLAQFTLFLSKHIELPEIEHIVKSSFNEFINRNILQYPESRKFPIHFTGSIAFHFKAQLEASLSNFNLQASSIVASPIDNLVKYHS
jgi:N-acetylglucosamine kinase-like BadF-type ATPase